MAQPNTPLFSELEGATVTPLDPITPPFQDREYSTLNAYPSVYPEATPWFKGISPYPQQAFSSQCMTATVSNTSAESTSCCNDGYSYSKTGKSNQYLYPNSYASRPQNSLYSQCSRKVYKPFPYTNVYNNQRRSIPRFLPPRIFFGYNVIESNVLGPLCDVRVSK